MHGRRVEPVTDRRENLRAIFDVENPKEAGRNPFTRMSGDGRWERETHRATGRRQQLPLRTDSEPAIRTCASACGSPRRRGMSVPQRHPIHRQGTHPAERRRGGKAAHRKVHRQRHGAITRKGERRRRDGPRLQREGSLEGEQGPGRTGWRAPSNVRDSTDHPTEQGPEEQRSLRHRQERRGWQRQRRDGRDRSEREVREGNGRGDTVRLRDGGVLRGVRKHDAGKPRSR